MGVRGLTTFLNNNRQSLTETVRLDRLRDGDGDSQRIPAVIDAWGIIFQLYQDSLPWASGGEYLRFFRLVRTLVVAWRNVGLEPIFVFDGATPSEKHATFIERAQKRLSLAQAFYAAYPPSRSAPSFSRHEVVLPPLASQAFIYALSTMDVKCHFIPEGEADGVCVSIAAELGAYVFGSDSDYLILTAGTGVRGYVPVKDMIWIEGSAEGDLPARPRPASPAQDEWYTSSRQGYRQRRPGPQGSPLLPSSHLHRPNLVLTVVRPDAFSRRLRLPASVLPLFSSLIGNDYTPPSAPDHFFEHHLDFSQKVEKVARILREVLAAPRSRVVDPGDSTTALVSRAVKALLIKPWTHAGKVDLVEAIIEATMQYLPPPVGVPCPAYPFCGAASTAFCSSHPPVHSEAASRYAAAQRRGILGSVTHAWLVPDRIYAWSVLEDPNAPSFQSSEGLRLVRRLAWEIVEEGMNGLRWGPPTEDEMRQWEEDRAVKALLQQKEELSKLGSETDDSGISTPVTANSGEQEELDVLLGVKAAPAAQTETASVSTAASTLVDPPFCDVSLDDRPTHTKLRVVTEYLRQGTANRIVPVDVPLSKRLDLPRPRCLLSLSYRLRLYLKALHSAIEPVTALPAHFQPLAALLRMCVLESASRAHKSDGVLWRRSEVETVLRACLGSWAAWQSTLSSRKIRPTGHAPPETYERLPLLETRHAGIVAQLTATTKDALLLAQALLILPEEGGQHDLTHMVPFVWLSGVTLHAMLNGDAAPESCWKWSDELEAIQKQCTAAVMDGMASKVVDRPHPSSKSPKSPARGSMQSQQQSSSGASHGHKHERASETEGQSIWRGGRWRGRGGSTSANVPGRGTNGFDVLAHLDTSS